MTSIILLKRINRLHFLIKRKATGSPKNLAKKFEISERHVYRLIEHMKEIGFPIKYSSCRSSYIYTSPVDFHLKLVVGDEAKLVFGGKMNQSFLPVGI